MSCRSLGGTGLTVSEIAFGAHGVDSAELMAAALDAGITTFCTSGGYLDGREEEVLGATLARLATPREEVVLVTGDEIGRRDTPERVVGRIEESLTRLRTDVIDVYYNAMVETPEDLRVDGLLEGFERARAAGKVRCLGLSGHHGGLEGCLEAAIAIPEYSVFFVKYDFVSYPGLDGLLERAAARGIGTLVFKTGAGNRQHEIRDLEKGGLSFPQATLRWALGNPNVSSVAVTMTSFEKIREAAGAVGRGLSTAEVAMLRRYADEMYHRYCRFCRTCEAACPHGVAVAEVMRYEMYFSGYGREKEAMMRYGGLPRGTDAAPCEGCAGPCDRVCPFGRDVRAGLVDAHRRLGFARA
jgi:aryl-alcohol dehydrogenase-like predicted oxidoreductase